MNPRRLSRRKQVQVMVALTILAWATQTLFHQWGYGQDISAEQPSDTTSLTSTPDLPAADKFVPTNTEGSPAGTLELRQDASIAGADVKLKQICRWSDADAPAFTPVADLVIAHLPVRASFQSLSVDDIRQTLHGAGVNIAMINFAGATACTVTRSDVQVDPHEALQQWIDAHRPDAGKSTPIEATVADPKADPNFHSLRDLLAADICQRLSILPDAIQLTFSPQDEKVLSLVEPCFKFDIGASRARALGNVSWDVTIFTDSTSKKVSISAVARAWQDQVIVAHALAAKEIFTAADFTSRRILLDSLPEHPLLRVAQCVGQQAATELRPGTIMTSQLVDPVPLVRSGQLVTVILTRGSVEIRSVARAMEQGSLGQTIKVRNENTRDVLDVTITGEQEARFGGPKPADSLTATN